MHSEGVKKLAQLARIKISRDEEEQLAKDLAHILDYVSEIQETRDVHDAIPKAPAHSTVMRDDGEPHESGAYTADIVAQFPKYDGEYLKVKKIL